MVRFERHRSPKFTRPRESVPRRTTEAEALEFMPSLLLIRHGEHDFTDPRPETIGHGLTPRGRQQARAVAAWLGQCGNEITNVCSSDYRRARATAEPVVRAFPSAGRIVDAMFRECADAYPRRWNAAANAADAACEALCAMTRAGPGATVAVAHANLIRHVLVRLLRWPEKRWAATSLGNGSVSIVEIDAIGDAPPREVAVGALLHLPAGLRDEP